MAPKTTIYKCPDGNDFPIEWEDPEDERYAWLWDQLHCPLPLTPLSAEFWNDIYIGFNRGGEFLGALGYFVVKDFNGFNFMRQQPHLDAQELRLALTRNDIVSRGSRLLELWEERYKPECEALNWSVRLTADSGLTVRELVERLPIVHAARRRLGELHTLAIGLTGGAAARLIRMCKEEFAEEGDLIAADLMAGFHNKSLESAIGLSDLAQRANAMPAVAQLLKGGPPASFLEGLDSVTDGPEFRRALDEYLDAYGHRNESFSELSFPTWREDPRFPLLMVRRYVDAKPEASPAAMHRRVVARREQRLAEVTPRFATETEKLKRFQGALKDAQQRTVLLEDHNFYIDQAGPAATRAFCLAIGRGLLHAGAIDIIDDVFYLREGELLAPAAFDYRAGIRRRRLERDRWMRVLPPASVGAAPLVMPEPMVQFFGPASNEPMEAGAFRGVAGSSGVIRGIARLILTLDDIDRLAPGEILVTYATAPPWTPAFAIAGGIVTDVGRTLSHCAVVAREYGIPAVVGTRVATATIQDGQLITVDGTSGIVRLEN